MGPATRETEKPGLPAPPSPRLRRDPLTVFLEPPALATEMLEEWRYRSEQGPFVAPHQEVVEERAAPSFVFRPFFLSPSAQHRWESRRWKRPNRSAVRQ